MNVLLCLLGIVLGLLLGGGSSYLLFYLLHFGASASLTAAAVISVLAAVYGAVALPLGVYGTGLGILGYVLDVTWSLLNSLVGFVFWAPICLITGAKFVSPSSLSKRSGTFVFDQNPRGGGYAAMTLGNVIAGGWSSHEETHVWQARIFGPLYLPIYVVSLTLNLIFRAITFDFTNYGDEAYRRICYEDWAYAAGHVPGSAVEPGYWLLWFLLSSIYVGLVVGAVVGIIVHNIVLVLVSIGGLVLYSVIRAFLPGAK